MAVEEVSKVNHLPPDTSVRVSAPGWLPALAGQALPIPPWRDLTVGPLQKEEKLNEFNVSTFPFFKEGCHARRVMTGWLE